MTGLLFSCKDIAVLISAFIATIIGLFFLKTETGKPPANKVLGLFLCIQSCASVFSIPLYSYLSFKIDDPTRTLLLGTEEILIVLEAFLLYWYTKILLFKDFSWGNRIYFHLALMSLVIVFAHIQLYRNDLSISLACPSPEKARITVAYALLHLIRCMYAGLCFANIGRYQRLLENKYSNTEKIDLSWLKLLIGGYLVARIGWGLIPVWFVFWYYSGFNFGTVGLVVTQYSFLFDAIWLVTLSALMYFALHYSPRFEGLIDEGNFAAGERYIVKEEHVRRVEDYMCEHKPYLSMNLKSDDLAEKLALPTKTLSIILNTHFKKNFCEFVNHYRVKDATLILSSPQLKDKTILDIAMEVGFNSKSSFNRAFKKETGNTPLKYRQRAFAVTLPPMIRDDRT